MAVTRTPRPSGISLTIRHEGDKWVVYSADGKQKLGTYDTEKEAKDRLRQVEHFKQPMMSGAARGRVWLAAVTFGGSDTGPFEAADTEAKRRWIRVAVSGEYRGYKGGAQPFKLTRQHLDEMVAALHEHPSYSKGAGGEGETDVVKWDFEHSSAPENWTAMVALSGVPSIGWTSDLKVVSAGGADELWALTRFLEPALGYVKAGKYRGASIDATLLSVDRVTAERGGAVLRAVALTNDPFLQGMDIGDGRIAAGDWYPKADSPQGAVNSLRQLFGLPLTSGVVELGVELEKIGAWAEAGVAPLGVDLEDVTESMRGILGLGALEPLGAVLDNARQIVQRLLQETPGVPQPSTAAPMMSSRGDTDMDIKLMAKTLGTRETDEAVLGAVEDLQELNLGVRKLLGNKRGGVAVLLEAVEESVDARTRLETLLKALGVEDYSAGADKIATLIQQGEELKKVMPELEGMKAKVKEGEKAAETADVEQAMASYGLDEIVKDALLLLRATDPKKFAERYPKKPGAPQRPAGQGGPGAPVVDVSTLLGRVAPAAGQGGRGAQVINLAQYDGPTKTARALKHLSLTVQGWEKLSYEEQCKRAFELNRRPDVVDDASVLAAG